MYFWKIGEQLPEIKQHSLVKHRIIEGYVFNYIKTLMARAHIPKLQLTLVDGFSGGGCYIDEAGMPVDGSPLLMMRAVREARALLNIDRKNTREVCVNYEFIDIASDATRHLDFIIKCRSEEGSIDACDANSSNTVTADFIKEIPRIVNGIKSRKSGERAIFILDQYNYNDLPLPNIKNILSILGGAEVVLTFNVGSLITFLSDRAANRKPVDRIGLGKYVPWDDLNKLKAEDKQWKRKLQRHLAYGIKIESGAKFATLFFVKPHGNNTWDYWLIHLSNHYKAHEVMKDLHWENATDFSHELEPGVFIQGYDANKDNDYTGQNPFDFGNDSKVACVDGIREHLGQTIYSMQVPKTLGELISSCISNSPGTTRHFIEAASMLHRSKDIIVVSNDGRKRRPSKNYRSDDVIEPSPQIRIIT